MADRTLDQFARDLSVSAEGGGLIAVVRKAMVAVSLKAARNAKINATTAPKVRTGALRNSIRSAVSVSGQTVSMTLGASMVYARIQEYGGTILFKTRSGSVHIRQNRYLGKAMDTSVADAKVSVMAAVKAYLESGRVSG